MALPLRVACTLLGPDTLRRAAFFLLALRLRGFRRPLRRGGCALGFFFRRRSRLVQRVRPRRLASLGVVRDRNGLRRNPLSFCRVTEIVRRVFAAAPPRFAPPNFCPRPVALRVPFIPGIPQPPCSAASAAAVTGTGPACTTPAFTAKFPACVLSDAPARFVNVTANTGH